jgi:hypothetical protein
MKKILVVVLLVAVTLGAFAAEKKSSEVPWLVSFNSPGTTGLALGVGYTQGGLGVAGTLGLTFGQFALGPIPLSWGVNVLADLGIGYYLSLGAGAFFSLELGMDFGGAAKFDWQLGIGPAITFDFTGYYPFGFGIGQYGSVTWWFSDKMGLTLQDAYAYTFVGPNLYFYGIGVAFKF